MSEMEMVNHHRSYKQLEDMKILIKKILWEKISKYQT